MIVAMISIWNRPRASAAFFMHESLDKPSFECLLVDSTDNKSPIYIVCWLVDLPEVH